MVALELCDTSLLTLQLREVDPSKEKLVLEQITWRLDKMENDTLPQVDLNVTEVSQWDVCGAWPEEECGQ